MNAFLFIVTGLVVLVGSSFTAIAPIATEKKVEKRLRIIGVCLTVAGGLLGVVIGLRSAAKTDALMRSTAQIMQTSAKTLSAVDETLETSKGVLMKTQENLDKTKESLEIASRTSVNLREASSYVSGGDAYPVVFAHAVTREDGARQIGFVLSKQGKYPLYELKVFVGKPYKTSAVDTTIQTLGASRQFQELNGNASYPLWFQPIPEENSTFYSVIMSARSGNWEEVINVQKVSSGIAMRSVLFWSKDPRVTPNKRVFDLADENFPPAERKKKIYPLAELALPVAPRP
jgi:hypothetical protein